MTIYLWILLKIRNVSNKVVKKIKMHIVSSTTFSENRAVYAIMSKKIGGSKGPRRQYGSCALHAGLIRLHMRKHMPASMHPHPHPHQKNTNAQAQTCKHTWKYVILIAFPQQKWFCKRASVLRYMHIACLVNICFNMFLVYMFMSLWVNLSLLVSLLKCCVRFSPPGSATSYVSTSVASSEHH
jgi:hypothetical protein